MKRLDEMTLPELNKLYRKSSVLDWYGNVKIVLFCFFLLGLIGSSLSTKTGGMTSPSTMSSEAYNAGRMSFIVMGFLSCFSIYVFKHVRNRGSRFYFYVWSTSSVLLVLGSLLFGLSLLSDIKNDSFAIVMFIGTICFSTLLSLLTFGIFTAARTDCLFAPTGFAHEQIEKARKNVKLGIPFSDEDLMRRRYRPVWGGVCVTFSLIFEIILFMLIVIFFGGFLSNFNNPIEKADKAMKRSDYETAFNLYRESAKSGDKYAQYQLGELYFSGKGVEKNTIEAIKWFRRSAAQDNPNAQCALGNCYLTGLGIEKNESEGVAWIYKAALQGNINAQFIFGNCLFSGIGIERNPVEAINWYRKAAEQGDADAQTSLGVAFFQGIGVKKNETEAVNWYRKAAEQGNCIAQTSLGDMYFEGKGVGKSELEAVNWYRKAAEQGFARAQVCLAACYINGFGVKANITEAIKWLRLAAEQGDENAQKALQEIVVPSLDKTQ